MKIKRSAKVIELQPPLRCAEPTPADMELEENDIAWAARSGMWQRRVAKASARRTKRAKAQPALILAGHGVSLRVENGALTIQNGFTHYPQKREISAISAATSRCQSALFYWTAAAAFPLMSYRGSPNKKSALFALTGKATLSASQVRRVIQPILIACAGNWRPAKIPSREMIFAAR
jgi:hypothetical protein